MQLGNLVRDGGSILSVPGKNFDAHRTTFGAAEQSDDHLFMPPFAVAIVARGDDIALGVSPFKVAAGYIIEYQVTIFKMTACQRTLDGALALRQPIHGVITMCLDIDFAFGAALFPQSGVFPLVGQCQLATGVEQPTDNHRQAISYPGFTARVQGTVESELLGQLQKRAA